MEGLRLRAFAVGGILLLAGALVQMTPAKVLPKKTEDELAAKAPRQVGDFIFAPGYSADQSYRVHESTYEVLKPFGIVGRIYQKGPEAYDVLLIASNDKNSFHDQRVCFRAQNWTILEETQDEIVTDRGTIPVTMVRMEHPELGPQFAAYFYKGPGGFYSQPQRLTWAMFLEQVRGGTNLDSVFYRFVPATRDATREQLFGFIREYVKAAEASSGGYY